MKYYCSFCDSYWTDEEILENQECPECLSECEIMPDPPYDHTGYDTLEEKNL